MKINKKHIILFAIFLYFFIIWMPNNSNNLEDTKELLNQSTSNYTTNPDNSQLNEDTTDDYTNIASDTTDDNTTTKTEEEIVVDLRGAVSNPGVYHLPVGSRMYELIEMADGLDNANEECINQAKILEDESLIYIPSASEECTQTNEATSEDSASEKININTSDADTLSTLPGIGTTRAQDIINYREENGDFKSIEELKNVSGIGDATFANISDLITV